MTASICGTNARVVAVFSSKTDPVPGVSTRHIPDASSGLGMNTSTASTPLRLAGFSSSEMN